MMRLTRRGRHFSAQALKAANELFQFLWEELPQRAETLTPFSSLTKCKFLTGRNTPGGFLFAT